MKKHLLLLSLTLITTAFAQTKKEQVVKFDFTKPTELNPSIVPGEGHGYAVIINDTVFSNQDITINFEKFNGDGAVSIETFINRYTEEKSYNLRVRKGIYTIVKSSEFALIKKVEFEGYVGDLEYRDNLGTWYDNVWESIDNNYQSQVKFFTNGASSEIKAINVTYLENPARLTPTLDHSTGADYNEFSSLVLTFGKQIVKKNKTVTATFRGQSVGCSVSYSGNNVTIRLDKTVSTDGQLTFSIPAGCFETNDGYSNKELHYTFNIVKKRDTFKPTANPANGSTLHSLESGKIALVFSSAVSDFSDSLRYRLFSDAQVEPVCLIKPVRGSDNKTVVLEFIEAESDKITEVGVYRISIPEKQFYHFKGDTEYESWNPEINLTYVIKSGEILVPTSVEPDTKNNLKEFSGIKLTYDKEFLPFEENPELTVKYNDKHLTRTVSIDKNVVSIDLAEPVKTDGTIIVHIPTNSFVTEDGFSNVERNYEYTIVTQVTGLRAEGKELLENIGVGYPAPNSVSRLALDSIVNAPGATVEGIQEAMDAFIAETDIQLPNNNEYYKISGINSKGEQLYVAYKNGSISISKNKADAAIFASSQKDGKVILKTDDDKTIHVLTAKTGYKTCITNDKELSALTIGKLSIAGQDMKATFGYVTMFGMLDKDDSGEINTYTVFNFEKSSLSDALFSEPRFDEKFSSALVFETAVKPDRYFDLSTKSVNCKLKDGKYILTVVFKDEDKVSLVKSPTQVVVKNQAGEALGTKFEARGTEGTITVDLGSIVPGNYTLEIPAMALKSTVGDDIRYNKAKSIPFVADKVANPEVGFTKELSTAVELLNHFVRTDEYPCEYLNDFIITLDKSVKRYELKYGKDSLDLVNHADTTWQKKWDPETGKYVMMPDKITWSYMPGDLVPTNKTIRLEEGYSGTVLRNGHLVRYYNNIPANYCALRIEFEEGPIAPNEISDGLYKFVFEAATYGDANFGKYLDDPDSIDPKKCNVNPALDFYLYVGNELVSLKTPKTNLYLGGDNIYMYLTFDCSDVITILDESKNVYVDDIEYTLSQSGYRNGYRIDLGQIDEGEHILRIPDRTLEASNIYGGKHPNKELIFTFNVELNNITAIEAIESESGERNITDLFGRRVSDTSKPGMYIINGKKVMVK